MALYSASTSHIDVKIVYKTEPYNYVSTSWLASIQQYLLIATDPPHNLCYR